jgi:hypothetical protein
MSLFSTSKELIVQAAKIFSSKEEDAIKTIARQVVTEMGYSIRTQRKKSSMSANGTSPPYGPNPRPLPDNLQTITATTPGVIVNGAGTFYGYAESGSPLHYGKLLQIGIDGRNIFSYNYGTQCPMSSMLLYAKKGGSDSKWTPPYGQLVIPFNNELSVRKLPAGLSLSLWWTVR